MKLDADEVIGGNAKLVRNINRSGILNIIRERQPISRIAISKLTGLNKSTVSSIVNELLEQDLIYEEMVQDQNVGRNPILLHLKLGRNFVGAINLDSAKSRVAIVDIDGTVLCYSELETEPENETKFIGRCAREVRRMQKEYRVDELAGIGFSIAGIVDPDNELVINAPNIGWNNFRIGQISRKIFDDVENLQFENDAKSSALAELWFGNGPVNDISDFVFLTVGIGIGTGIVVGKNLLDGYMHAAGEFGHMTMFPNGEYCACGNYGCFEAYASDRATVKRFQRLCKNDGCVEHITEVIDKALGGDILARQALEETGNYLGLGIANIIKAVDPEAVVIGGHIVRAWDIISPEIQTVVKEHILFDIKREVKILPTSLKIRPRLLGAATLALKEIFRDYRITR